jgi:hypothetical protein
VRQQIDNEKAATGLAYFAFLSATGRTGFFETTLKTYKELTDII